MHSRINHISCLLDWTGLVWTGLDWTGLDWTGLDWTGLDWTGLDWSGERSTCLTGGYLLQLITARNLTVPLSVLDAKFFITDEA